MKFLTIFVLFLSISICEPSRATNTLCEEIYQDSKKAFPVLHDIFGPVDEFMYSENPTFIDGETFALHMCQVADTNNLTDYSALAAPTNNKYYVDRMHNTYNTIVAKIEYNGGIQKFRRVNVIYSEIIHFLINYGFPDLPLKTDPGTIRGFLDPIISELSPNFVSQLFGNFEEVDSYFEKEENVVAFSEILTEVTSIEEFMNRFGLASYRDEAWTLYGKLRFQTTNYDINAWASNAMNVFEALYHHGFFNFNHIDSYTVRGKTKTCIQLGEQLFANKDDIAYYGTVMFREFSERLFLHLMGEYLKIDVFSERDWISFSCWLAAQNSFQYIYNRMGLTDHEYAFYHYITRYFNEDMGGNQNITKYVTVAQILVPYLAEAGYSKFPLNTSYDATLAVLEKLYEEVGPDFPNYLDPSPGRQFKLGIIEDLEYVAQAIVDASDMEELENKLNIPRNYLLFALIEFEKLTYPYFGVDAPRLLHALTPGMEILQKIDELGLLNLENPQYVN